MSARELEDFIGIIEKAESSVSYITDIYAQPSRRNGGLPPSQSLGPVPRLSFPPSPSSYYRSVPSTNNTLPTTTRSSITGPTSSKPLTTSPGPLKHPPFGRVIARDLSPAITPESSPLTRKKKTPLQKNSRVDSRSSTPSPPRSTPPHPQPAPKLTRKRTKTPKAQPVPTVNLKNYAKSLGLLGISLADERNTKVEEPIFESTSSRHKSPSPTFRTRLSGRTQSLSDIRKTLNEKGRTELPLDEFKGLKSNLCQAVFEEWYFSKAAQEAEKKLKAKEERLAKRLLEGDDIKKEKADNNFRNWLRSKKDSRVTTTRNKTTEDTNEKKVEKIETVAAKEKEWMDKKNRELRERRRVERLTQKEAAEAVIEQGESKKRENAKHFEEWSKAWSRKMKERRLKEREKRKREREESIERLEAAELSFKAWMTKKKADRRGAPDKKVQIRNEKNEIKEKEVEDEEIKEKDRSLKSSEAFKKWLESLELRDEVRTADEEFQLREMWKPPWYPPGY